MLLQIISHTPPWVFGLLIALIFLGLQQRKNRRVKRPLAFLLPLGMMALSFAGVLTSFGLDWINLLMWALGLSTGAVMISLWFPVKGIKYQYNNATFYIPGSWTPLIVILAIFMTKYSVGVLHGLNPDSLNSPALRLTLSFIYGLLSGYFVGRAICLRGASQNKTENTA